MRSQGIWYFPTDWTRNKIIGWKDFSSFFVCSSDNLNIPHYWMTNSNEAKYTSAKVLEKISKIVSLTLKTLVRHMMWVVCDVWEWWSDKKRAKIWTGHIGAQNTDEYFPKLNRQENIQDINELLLVQWKRLNIFMHPLYQQYQNKTSSCWDEEWALDEGFSHEIDFLGLIWIAENHQKPGRYLQSVKTRQISLFVLSPPVVTHYPAPTSI